MNAIHQNESERPRPKALSVAADNIPPELRTLNQWVVWGYSYDLKRGQWTKLPYCVHGGGMASSTDSRTWSSFDDALQRYQAGGMDGIGFVVTTDSGIIGVDLDHCFNRETRTGEQWAIDIIQQFQSYTEFSPSREGIRIFIEGNLPGGVAGKKKGNIEIYSAGRYLTVTGHRLKNAPATIESRQDQIDRLFREVFTDQAKPKTNGNGTGNYHHHSIEDDDLLEKAFAAQNGRRVKQLFDGDFVNYPSQSEADLALCSMLAFWAQDEAQLDRLFRRSALMRPKWDEKHGAQTYGQSTIEKAFTSRNEHYNGREEEGRHDNAEKPLNSLNSLYSHRVQPFPKIDQAAFYGLPGNIVEAIEPYSEADPVAILVNILIASGNCIGSGPHFLVEKSQHHLNTYGVEIGKSAKGRKGMAWSTPKFMLHAVDPDWAEKRIKSGLSSGEGLVYAVRDQRTEKKPYRENGRVAGHEEIIVDEGESDKRLLCVEEEFCQALKVMMREGNILSPILRDAWDGKRLAPMTKSSPLQATDAHISIIAHITKDDLDHRTHHQR